MQTDSPLFSIITVCKNAATTLETAIASVASQSFRDIQYIVIDGASCDGTADILENYTKDIDILVSEPDQGIADAMNKGLDLANGKYIYFLHADDHLISDTVLQEVAVTISSSQISEIHSFSIERETGERKRLVRSSGFTFMMNLKTGIPHQGAFCDKALFSRIGRFDPRYSIAMDYDFFLRAYRNQATLMTHDIPVAVMGTEGLSSRRRISELLRRFSEEYAIQARNSKSFGHWLLYLTYWPAYACYASIRHGVLSIWPNKLPMAH
jgi:glycosyltransferase involved in cell wall biosynthesis